ncbi:MAG TPA: tetratricopeptide repeat protein [Polyangiales bacterium]|nr:tetratricopeptide repeat protein [Polyangiales bacterium]
MQRFASSFGLGCFVILMSMGADCSRARVESINKMNEGVTAAVQKRYVDATKLLEQAGVVDPQNDQVFWNLALVHMELHKYDRARDDLNKAIAINPQSGGYQEKLGTILMELKDWNGAKQAMEKAIATEPELFKAYYKLAQINEQLDDQQSALKNYTAAIDKGPRFLEAYNALGRLYADLNYLDQSSQVLQEALKVALPGTEEEAQAHHLLGTVLQQQKKFDQAVAEFKAALAVVPGMRDALFSLGWTYHLQGNKDEAKRYLQKFVDVAGAEAPAHYVKAARDKIAEMAEGFATSAASQ